MNMNEAPSRTPSHITRRVIASGRLAGSLLLATVLAACGSATVQGQPQLMEETANGQALNGASHFLGGDASLLQPGNHGQAAYVYISPTVKWSDYNKVLLHPVEFWDTADSTVSPGDQRMLCSYFYNALKQSLEKHFTMVDTPGPGVMTIRVALINASAATAGLRSISVVIPQARILNYAQSLATGHAAFAGSAEAAGKIADSVSGQLMAESVDERMGGMAVSQAAQVQWGDAESVMNYWAEKLARRMVQLGAGSQSAAL